MPGKIKVSNFSPEAELPEEDFLLQDAMYNCDIEEIKLLFPHKTQHIHGSDLCMLVGEGCFEIMFFFLDNGLNPDQDLCDDWSLIHTLVEDTCLCNRYYLDEPSSNENYESAIRNRKALKRFVEKYKPNVNKPFSTETVERGYSYPLDMCDEEWTYKYLVSRGAVHASGKPAVW